MEDNRIKPSILNNNTLLRRNISASADPNFFQGLPMDTERDERGKNRHLEIRRDEDKISDPVISLKDIDEAVFYYLSEGLNALL